MHCLAFYSPRRTCLLCHKINYAWLSLKLTLHCCRARNSKRRLCLRLTRDLLIPGHYSHTILLFHYIFFKNFCAITFHRCFAITMVTPGRRMCFCMAAVWRKPCGNLDLPLTRSPWKKTQDTGYAYCIIKENHKWGLFYISYVSPGWSVPPFWMVVFTFILICFYFYCSYFRRNI